MVRRAFLPWARILAVVVLLGAAVPSSSADSIDVFALVNAKVQDIGTLTWTISNTNQGNANYPPYFEGATFQLNNTFKYLMSDPGCQFRVFQVVTRDDAPPLLPGGTPVTVPYVDPVSGGYQYQQPFGGADTSPFYENDDGPKKYAYYKYSDVYANTGVPFPANTPVHDASKGFVTTWDQPGVGANERVDFQTYVAFNDPGLQGSKTLDLLGGFSWSITSDNTGKSTLANGGSVDMSQDGLSVTIDTSLTDGGFSGWSWTQYSASNVDLGVEAMIYCPEPSSIVLLSLGLGVLAVRCRPRGAPGRGYRGDQAAA